MLQYFSTVFYRPPSVARVIATPHRHWAHALREMAEKALVKIFFPPTTQGTKKYQDQPATSDRGIHKLLERDGGSFGPIRLRILVSC